MSIRIIKVLALIACLGYAGRTAVADPPDPVLGCELRSQVDKKTSGRFIWKPVADHFRQALVVAPRHFYPHTPRVDLFDTYNGTGKRIEAGQLKSNGRCSGSPECLFASTFLFKKMGKHYQNRYGTITIRIKDPKKPELGCYYYLIDRAGARAEFR